MNPGYETYRPFGQRARGTVTVAKVPAAGDTVTIAGTIYTFGTTFWGNTPTEVAKSLAAAINSDRALFAAMHTQNLPERTVFAMFFGTVVRVVATEPGVGGNSITLATSAATTFVLSAATLTSGTASTTTLGTVLPSLSACTTVVFNAGSVSVSAAGYPLPAAYAYWLFVESPTSNSANMLFGLSPMDTIPLEPGGVFNFPVPLGGKINMAVINFAAESGTQTLRYGYFSE